MIKCPKDMDVKIKRFNIHSYENVFTLWKQCDGVGLGESDTKDNILLFLNRNPGMSFLAEIETTLVGAVLAGHDGRRGYIHHLAVLPTHRKMGIGRMLVDNCLRVLKEAGILKCHIFLFDHNADGQKFWKSIGWTHRNDICVISKFN